MDLPDLSEFVFALINWLRCLMKNSNRYWIYNIKYISPGIFIKLEKKDKKIKNVMTTLHLKEKRKISIKEEEEEN